MRDVGWDVRNLGEYLDGSDESFESREASTSATAGSPYAQLGGLVAKLLDKRLDDREEPFLQ